MTFTKARSMGSAIALLRLLPYAFPIVFVSAAVTGTISVLYAAVVLHVTIIAAENTIGRLLASVPIAPLVQCSSLFEDACLLAWPAAHLAALAAALFLIVHTEPNARHAFAVGAIFGYSINIFSATVGHELLHRHSRVARGCASLMYAAMLYPHFPVVHLASHHRWAGSDRDCQTPRPGQPIFPYLGRALLGGLRIAPSARAAALDPHLRWRILAVMVAPVTLGLLGARSAMIFLVVQGLFSFILVETLNYIQHFKPMEAHASADDERSRLANQDLNFVSRCALFNLSLHAAHHAEQSSHYSRLIPIPAAPSCCWGYWTSFWLAWTPPLWNHLHSRKTQGGG